MEAKDFRLGNLVKSVLTKKPYEIDLWALRVIEEGNYQNSYDTETKVFELIPLTEQWFLDFGFEKINTAWFGIGNFRINISFDVEWGLNWMGVRLKYLHQLQNLYFALTNEELKLKSK
jgi:hypothetical protein